MEYTIFGDNLQLAILELNQGEMVYAEAGAMVYMSGNMNMQAKAKNTTAEGTAGGGMVTVTVTGECQVAAVSLQAEALEDRELLEDMIRAATNEAIRKVREKIAGDLGSLAGGLPIPPGILPGF